MLGNLSGLVLLAIDIAAWLIINLSVSWMVSKRSAESFNPGSWLYRKRTWEKNARFYEKAMKIKKWKNRLPDGAAVSKSGFRKKRLRNTDSGYLNMFIRETCRAEYLHWILLLLSLLFFIWNPWYIGIMMIAYAVIANMPCIFAQRYNRIRLLRVNNN